VLDAMLPFFTTTFGNPASSGHAWGWKAREAVESARKQVASLIGATAKEIIFTSGATESNNFAIRGAAETAPPMRREFVTSAVEHKSVLACAAQLEQQGWRVHVVPVHDDGRIDLAALGAVITDATALVSVMAANNEIGVIQPLAEIGRIAHERGALLHVDAAQAVGKIPIDVVVMNIDLLSLTAHKMYGPKGVGAIYIRHRTELGPLISGGGQERGMRAGTLNVPGIVGLGQACEICRQEMTAEQTRLRHLRDRLLQGLTRGVPGVRVNGSLEHRLAQNLHVSFEDVDGESLLLSIGDIAVSSGSACASASATPSHVLTAICGGAVPSASIRFGLGRFTTEDEIDYAIERFTTVVTHLRATAPAR
jgi:cysteine desulfurase